MEMKNSISKTRMSVENVGSKVFLCMAYFLDLHDIQCWRTFPGRVRNERPVGIRSNRIHESASNQVCRREKIGGKL